MRVSLAKRLAQLEERATAQPSYRVVLRYEGPGTEGFVQPTQDEIDSASRILVIRSVAARDGRPA